MMASSFCVSFLNKRFYFDDYIGNIIIQFESPYENLRVKDIYDGVMKVLQEVSEHIQKI